jgi:hypothetical protein
MSMSLQIPFEGHRFFDVILHTTVCYNQSEWLIFDRTVQIKYLILPCKIISTVNLKLYRSDQLLHASVYVANPYAHLSCTT